MIAEVMGTVESGALKLDEALPFPDKTRVKLRIERRWDATQARQAWQTMLAKIDEHPIVAPAAPTPERSCMIAIDTNVFVYAFDATEPEKQSKARQFFQDVFASAAATIIPWQVAVELLARFRKWEGAGK